MTDINLLKEIISEVEESTGRGYLPAITFNCWDGTALVSIDEDGTEHYKPTGEVVTDIKIVTSEYKPINV